MARNANTNTPPPTSSGSNANENGRASVLSDTGETVVLKMFYRGRVTRGDQAVRRPTAPHQPCGLGLVEKTS